MMSEKEVLLELKWIDKCITEENEDWNTGFRAAIVAVLQYPSIIKVREAKLK